MLNKVMLIGRLGADPEIRYSQSGAPVASLRLATDESYTDRDGNRTERTEWHRVVVFQRQAETCSQFLHKGSLVYVEGRLTTRKWQDQNGQDRYSTEVRGDRVLFLDRRGSNDGEPLQGSQQNQGWAQNGDQSGRAFKNSRNNDGFDEMEPSFSGNSYSQQRSSKSKPAPLKHDSENGIDSFPPAGDGLDDMPF